MIVQSNPTGDAHFVMTMSEHTALAGKFAAHFGNEAFEPVQPRDLMLHVVTHHDAGWQELDSNPQLDTTTGLPYNLVQTPFEWIIKTSSASPDFNAAYHPFCELLSSMHSWGLYNGRYGLSDKVLLDSLSADFRPAVDEMLEYERARQARLIACLKHNHESARWVEEETLMRSYKQLQFFDTLALYFNCHHPSERQITEFTHIPTSAGLDTTVAIEPLTKGRYRLSPYPFDEDELGVQYSGKLLEPRQDANIMRDDLASAPVNHQVVYLCS